MIPDDPTPFVQAGVQPDAPIAAPAGEPFGEPSAPSWPARGPDGKFLPGNLAAVKHALRSDRVPPEFQHLADELDTFIAGCVSDEGGDHEISTRRRSLLNYRARLHRRIAQLDAAIESLGLFSKDGKLRVAWLQRLEGLINTAKGLDSLLGLDRRQKRIPSLDEVLDGR